MRLDSRREHADDFIEDRHMLVAKALAVAQEQVRDAAHRLGVPLGVERR